ncbi:MAG TPA: DUF5317 family protein [Chloroflexota bacterium]
MLGLLVPALVAFLIALGLGGSVDRWSGVRLYWWPLALLAFAVQVVLYSPPINAWPPLVAVGVPLGVLTTGMVLLVAVRNAAGGPVRSAWTLAAVGIALNLVVVIVNAGWMPSRRPALASTAAGPGFEPSTVVNTVAVVSDSRLVWLGDTLLEPQWLPLSNAVSPGDVLLSLGAAWFVFAVTRRHAPTLT